MVDSVIEGYNGTVFAYGQTGTGKTHSMDGGTTPELQGIIPNSFDHVFNSISAQSEDRDFLIRASFLEIYNEEIRDLLARNVKSRTLDLKEVDGVVYVKDLTNFTVRSAEEIRKVLEVGKRNRSVGATDMNQDSSRSHSVFTITVESALKVITQHPPHGVTPVTPSPRHPVAHPHPLTPSRAKAAKVRRSGSAN